jgi:hypothetical protein
LNTYDDFIDEAINPELAATALTVVALRWQKARLQDEETERQLNYWGPELERAKQEWPIDRPSRKARFIAMPRGGDGAYTGEPDKVRL